MDEEEQERLKRTMFLAIDGVATPMDVEDCFLAEKKQIDDENNPFSFKFFVQSSKHNPEVQKYEHDIDNSVKTKKTLVIVDEDSVALNSNESNICLNSSECCDAPKIHDHVAKLPKLPEVVPGVDEAEPVLDALPDFGITEVQDAKLNAFRKEIEFLNSALEKCQEDNVKLKAKLHSKNSRITDLEEKVKKLKLREAEDLLSLEQMVQQVELNLKITTERAVCAELSASKLNQEIKLLQDQINVEQKVKKEYEDNITLATEDLATKINTAANGAESSLKSLLEGVEQLRTLSSVAASISRIQEDRS